MTENRHLTGRTAVKAIGLLALGLVLAFAVSACGSSSASPGSTTTSSSAATGTAGTSASGTASVTAFRNCLSQHGFTQPQGGAGGGLGGGTAGGGRPSLSAAQQQAFSACASLRPAGGGFGGGGRPGGAGQARGGSTAFGAFQTCLKQHGAQTSSAGTASTSAKTQSAIAACQKLLPNGGHGTGAPSGTTKTTG